MNNWIYYVVALAIIVGAAWTVKKVASCLVKAVAMAVNIAVVAYIYFYVYNP